MIGNARLCGVLTGAVTVDYSEGPASNGHCFIEAVDARRPAVVIVNRSTHEGDPIIEIFRYEPGDGIVVISDSTRDNFGSGHWFASRCSSVTFGVGLSCTS